VNDSSCLSPSRPVCLSCVALLEHFSPLPSDIPSDALNALCLFCFKGISVTLLSTPILPLSSGM